MRRAKTLSTSRRDAARSLSFLRRGQARRLAFPLGYSIMKNKFKNQLLTLMFAVLTVIGTAQAAEGLEAKRVAQNKAGLQKMHSSMRPKVRAVLSGLEGHGYKPIIDVGVYRSPVEQAAKVRAGYSKVSYSYHCVTGKNGQPESLAADVTDQRWGWTGSTPRAYWLKQANAAREHGLHSGAYFGLSTANKSRLKSALLARNWNYPGPFGWDWAHVEASGLSLGRVKRGERP
jgi:hypothetical protein